MPELEPVHSSVETRVRASFARQTIMKTIGALLSDIRMGQVKISLPFSRALTQQHDFLHAGIVATIVDSACGYAVMTLLPPDTGVLAVEFKANFLSPAEGERFEAVGRVLKMGRTISVCTGTVEAYKGDTSKTVAVMQSTIMTIRDREGVID